MPITTDVVITIPSTTFNSWTAETVSIQSAANQNPSLSVNFKAQYIDSNGNEIRVDAQGNPSPSSPMSITDVTAFMGGANDANVESYLQQLSTLDQPTQLAIIMTAFKMAIYQLGMMQGTIPVGTIS